MSSFYNFLSVKTTSYIVKRQFTSFLAAERIKFLTKEYISEIYLFGSYARGDADENSDVDLHIYTKNHCGLLTLSGFRIDLVEKLGVKVDMVFNKLPEKNHSRY